MDAPRVVRRVAYLDRTCYWLPSARWRSAPAIRKTVRRALAGQPRGASVAFESIDGPPPDQFRQLVQNLNDEAQRARSP